MTMLLLLTLLLLQCCARVLIFGCVERQLLAESALQSARQVDARVGERLVAEYGARLVLLAALSVDVQVVGVLLEIVRIGDVVGEIEVDVCH